MRNSPIGDNRDDRPPRRHRRGSDLPSFGRPYRPRPSPAIPHLALVRSASWGDPEAGSTPALAVRRRLALGEGIFGQTAVMEPRCIVFPMLTGRLLIRPMALADAEELLEVYRDAETARSRSGR